MVLGRWLVRAVRRARGAGAGGAGQLGERGELGRVCGSRSACTGVKRARPKRKEGQAGRLQSRARLLVGLGADGLRWFWVQPGWIGPGFGLG